MVLWRPLRPSRSNTPKTCPFHYRGLECKSRKSRDTWSNRQIWPCSTKWSSAKANRVLPRECTGHSKQRLPTTQEKTTCGHHQMFNTEIRLIIFFAAKDGEAQSVQFSSVTQLCPTLCDPWTPACQASLSIANSWSLPKLMSIELVMTSNHLILCPPLLLSPSIFPSIRVFSNESVLHIRWPKYWSFSFNISPSNEYSRLISFRMDWFDLLAVQGTRKSLLQHHCSKASILWNSGFFMVLNHILTWLLEKP